MSKNATGWVIAALLGLGVIVGVIVLVSIFPGTPAVAGVPIGLVAGGAAIYVNAKQSKGGSS